MNWGRKQNPRNGIEGRDLLPFLCFLSAGRETRERLERALEQEIEEEGIFFPLLPSAYTYMN